MPRSKDASGTKRRSPKLIFFSSAALLIPMVVCAGCSGLGKASAIRALGDTNDSLTRISADDPPLDDRPASSPMTGKATGLEKDDGNLFALKRLARRAVEQEKSMNNYMCRIRRKEQVDGKDRPEEIIMLKYCRAPLSIHCKWLGDEAKGREIIYVHGQNENRVNVLTGRGDMLGAGKRMTFPLESPIVRSKSRYPLTEAGLGAAVMRFSALINAIDHGQANAGTARYLGLQSRSEFARPVEAVEQTIPANLESFLPRGGFRYFFFEEATGLPMVVVTIDDNKRQVEYYHFDRLQCSVNLDETDFDPDMLWKK
jgi:hypothetical protein